MFGINPSELLVLIVVAAVVIGPERLPRYAQQLAAWTRQLRMFAQRTAHQVREEMGPEFDEVDWRTLDPRQYDPRRIVRETLSDVIDLRDPLGLAERPTSSRRPGDSDSTGDRPETDRQETTRPETDRPETDRPAAFDPDAT